MIYWSQFGRKYIIHVSSSTISLDNWTFWLHVDAHTGNLSIRDWVLIRMIHNKSPARAPDLNSREMFHCLEFLIQCYVSLTSRTHTARVQTDSHKFQVVSFLRAPLDSVSLISRRTHRAKGKQKKGTYAKNN